MRRFCLYFILSLVMLSPQMSAEPAPEGVPAAIWLEAAAARERFNQEIKNDDLLVLIDYTQVSNRKRFYVVDLIANKAQSYLVAHGQGSDTDHDGIAEAFSNRNGSRMTSLGAFVTGETYYGRHGLSLRLHGLEARNDQAYDRAIVIHGAAYVSPERRILGRSWGCPALEQEIALELIPKLQGGVFVYVVGTVSS